MIISVNYWQFTIQDSNENLRTIAHKLRDHLTESEYKNLVLGFKKFKIISLILKNKRYQQSFNL